MLGTRHLKQCFRPTRDVILEAPATRATDSKRLFQGKFSHRIVEVYRPSFPGAVRRAICRLNQSFQLGAVPMAAHFYPISS